MDALDGRRNAEGCDSCSKFGYSSISRHVKWLWCFKYNIPLYKSRTACLDMMSIDPGWLIESIFDDAGRAHNKIRELYDRNEGVAKIANATKIDSDNILLSLVHTHPRPMTLSPDPMLIL